MTHDHRWSILFLSHSLALARDGYADDHHAGYSNAELANSDVDRSEVQDLPGANRVGRCGFVVIIANTMIDKFDLPRSAFFAKGPEAALHLLVALEKGVVDRVCRGRAFVAAVTSLARTTPVFHKVGPAALNVFDFLKALGFERLTISDSDGFAHQVEIQ